MRKKTIFIGSFSIIRFSILILLFFWHIPLYAGDTLPFPYKLGIKTEVPLVSGAALLGILGYYFHENQPTPDSADILGLKSMYVNALDRTAVDNYSATADRGSTVCMRTAQYTPFLLCVPLIFKKQWYPAITYTVMYFEARAINGSLTSISKSVSNRPRPYLYGSDLIFTQKLSRGKGGFRSFFSGHTSDAFCCATFLSKAFCDMYPSSKLKLPVWAVSMGIATATGILRYTAGKHYPTDIIAGACVGGAIGYFIPVLHKQKRNSLFSVYPIGGENCGIQVVYRL